MMFAFGKWWRLKPMMTASPNDVCLTSHWGKHRIIAKRSGATSYLRSKCIISPQAMHHLFPTSPKLWTDSNRHTPFEAFQKSFPFKNYLQSHRCNGSLDRFGLTKAFLREEGGPRSGGRSLRDFEIWWNFTATRSPSVAYGAQLPPGGSLCDNRFRNSWNVYTFMI